MWRISHFHMHSQSAYKEINSSSRHNSSFMSNLTGLFAETIFSLYEFFTAGLHL